MVNEYNESGAESISFYWANQTEANILANPQRCRGFIANDTGAFIYFDKDNDPHILRPGIPELATAPSAIAGISQMWYDTTASTSENTVFKIRRSIESGGDIFQIVVTTPE